MEAVKALNKDEERMATRTRVCIANRLVIRYGGDNDPSVHYRPTSTVNARVTSIAVAFVSRVGFLVLDVPCD